MSTIGTPPRMTPDLMEADALQAVKRIGLPETTVHVLAQLASERAAVRVQQFLPQKEKAEIAAVDSRADDRLKVVLDQLEAEALAERDEEVARLEAYVVIADRLPVKEIGESGDEFGARVALRQIEETRHLRAVVAAQSDVALALATDDIETLEALAVEALEGGISEHIRRVGRAVEHKLRPLAVAETAAAGSHAHVVGPAASALQRVSGRLSTWRASEAMNSPAGMRERVVARYEQRLRDVRAGMSQAGRAFGLSRWGQDHTR